MKTSSCFALITLQGENITFSSFSCIFSNDVKLIRSVFTLNGFCGHYVAEVLSVWVIFSTEIILCFIIPHTKINIPKIQLKPQNTDLNMKVI